MIKFLSVSHLKYDLRFVTLLKPVQAFRLSTVMLTNMLYKIPNKLELNE
jgi:hypothetical protein